MKKICFVLALVLMLSSLGIAPVFAAEDITVVDTMDGTERSSVSYASASVKSGNTTETITTGFTQSTGAAPQKNADDNALYVSGTATYTSTALSVSTGRDIYNVKNKTKGTHYASFTKRTYNEFSFDVYVGKNDKGFIPIYVNCGGVSRNFYLCTNDLYSDDSATRYASITGVPSGWIFYGLEREKWARVTVTHTMAYDTSGTDGNGTAKFTLYINGTEIPTFYNMTSSTQKADMNYNNAALARGKTVTGTQFSSQLSMCNNTGDVRDFYIDNVTYKASDTTAIVPGAAATISSADENGIVTVEDGALASSITATGAQSIEVYRKNSASATGYDLVESTAALATNDIIKLTSTSGAYSYYTVKVNRVAVPFSIGNLTAPEVPVKGGQITSSLALAGDTADKNVTLILALYKGITLCDMKTAEIKNGDAVSGNLSCTINVPDVTGNYTAKAFVWSDKDTMIQYK